MQIAPGWQIEFREQGQWLVAKVAAPHAAPGDQPPLADHVWQALRARQRNHLVLDFADMPLLFSYVIGQLVMLYKRVSTSGGAMRLCSLSPSNQNVLKLCRLDDHFPTYATPDDAVTGEARV
ncbi:MAG: STAS domain-containing protein [Planctomycetota bacterium]